MFHRLDHIDIKPATPYLLAICAAILLWTATYPFSRTFMLTQISYNEGWNVYNAQRVTEHQPLYPSPYGWISVNYPALSFHIVSALGRFTSDYLFTGRILSLAGLCLSGVFAGLIVWNTTRSKLASLLSGMFLVAIFCANATSYVGLDDPQMLAQAFFMGGIYVYLRGNRMGLALELTALLFVMGGNIKHNLIEFPLAVLLDLLMSSPRRALRFAIAGASMAALSVVLTIKIDGAAYLSCLLAPRSYYAHAAIFGALQFLKPILLPTAAAFFMACYCWKNSSRRVLALLLFCALAANTFFCGGLGVDINGMFGSMLAIVLLSGVFWAEFSSLPLGRLRVLPPTVVCAIFFLCLAVTMKMNGRGHTNRALRLSRASEQSFAVEVAYLRKQPGPALCEGLLHCYYAGKPYLYDPFNATRFIRQGKLNANVMVDRLRNREFGAVQLSGSVEQKLGDPNPEDNAHFVPPILRAIQMYYRPGFTNEDEVIYIPRGQGEQMSPKLAASN